MSASIWIKKLTLNDGTSLDLGKNDIVLFVGPNNAGKSVALQRIHELFSAQGDSRIPIVRTLEVQRDGTEEDLREWVNKNCQKGQKNGTDFVVTKQGLGHWLSSLTQLWNTTDSGPNALGGFFSSWAAAGNRLEVANPAQAINILQEAFTDPIHYLYVNELLEERLSKSFKEAFALDLLVNRLAGSQISLHCGTRPSISAGEDRLSVNYLKQIYALPALHGQGDGMRSFVGCLLLATVIDHSVVLIDEPEAFLHPPQARLLGRMLAKDKPAGRQLFVATHSGDFLRGLISVQPSNIRVLRIRRDGSINPVRELKPDRVRQLWKDSLLRYSHVLDGLFHERVVLCEGDSDCRFYEGVADALLDNTPEVTRPAVMFIHCGGKQRMPVIIDSLTNLGVPLRVVVDFDVLQAEQPLRKIYELLGGNWETVKADWEYVNKTVIQMKAELSTSGVKRELAQILDPIKENAFPDSAARAVREVVKKTSAWSFIKTTGRAGLPNGQPTQALDRLLLHCTAKGLYIVEVGELEGFDRSSDSHGPAWVNTVLEKSLASDTGLEEARRFVIKLIS